MSTGSKGTKNAEKGAAKPEKTPQDLKALEEFNRITEAASALMDVGEMDIYSALREELQRAADTFKDDDDMFADADKDDARVRLQANRSVNDLGHFLPKGKTIVDAYTEMPKCIIIEKMVHSLVSLGVPEVCCRCRGHPPLQLVLPDLQPL